MSKNTMTPEEKEGRINALRELLTTSERQAVEAADGFISHAEYAEMKAKRQGWRKELAELEGEQTVADLRKSKRAELRVACENAIIGGVDVGDKHYSLTERDQIELIAQAQAVKEGAAAVPYHADGELCEVMGAESFAAVAAVATAHIFYHRTYCNHLNKWADRATKTELDKITYGAELPADLAEHMAAIMGAGGGQE